MRLSLGSERPTRINSPVACREAGSGQKKWGVTSANAGGVEHAVWVGGIVAVRAPGDQRLPGMWVEWHGVKYASSIMQLACARITGCDESSDPRCVCSDWWGDLNLVVTEVVISCCRRAVAADLDPAYWLCKQRPN